MAFASFSMTIKIKMVAADKVCFRFCLLTPCYNKLMTTDTYEILWPMNYSTLWERQESLRQTKSYITTYFEIELFSIIFVLPCTKNSLWPHIVIRILNFANVIFILDVSQLRFIILLQFILYYRVCRQGMISIYLQNTQQVVSCKIILKSIQKEKRQVMNDSDFPVRQHGK